MSRASNKGEQQRSGLEPGDMIIGANTWRSRDLISSTSSRDKGVLKNLVVLDVNSGKPVRVPIEVAARAAAPRQTACRRWPAPSRILRSPRSRHRLARQVAGNIG